MDTFNEVLLIRETGDNSNKRTWGNRRVTGMQNFGERQVESQVKPGPTSPQTGDESSEGASETS